MEKLTEKALNKAVKGVLLAIRKRNYGKAEELATKLWRRTCPECGGKVYVEQKLPGGVVARMSCKNCGAMTL